MLSTRVGICPGRGSPGFTTSGSVIGGNGTSPGFSTGGGAGSGTGISGGRGGMVSGVLPGSGPGGLGTCCDRSKCLKVMSSLTSGAEDRRA